MCELVFFWVEGLGGQLRFRLVLDHFKPKLHDLFRSFARRQLRGPTDAKVGSGTTRLKERTIWKQTQAPDLGGDDMRCAFSLKRKACKINFLLILALQVCMLQTMPDESF